MTAVARDARPPLALVRVINPTMRVVLRTPLGRLVRPVALLDFTGRRSGPPVDPSGLGTLTRSDESVDRAASLQ